MNSIRKNSDWKDWSPSSWRKFKISQQPVYKDSQEVEKTLSKISSLPPIVHHSEIEDLKTKLFECHENRSFIIQVGDCAERFADATEEVIKRKIMFFNVLSHILSYHLEKEVITIGRIGGQYAKPRSNDFEIVEGVKLDVFRGEIINDITATAEKRVPDPNRMYEAYNHSVTTINQIKDWNHHGDKSLANFRRVYSENQFELKSDKFIKKLVEYYDTFPGEVISKVEENKIYTSHEGLLLNYEECFVRQFEEKYYDLSAHFLWIGERTGTLTEAHVEFFRGLQNPIGIKTSSRTNLDDLVEMIQLINPQNLKGKILIITRFGIELAETCLESLCLKIKHSGLNVLFVCDPNHGNTKVHQSSKKKVRFFDELRDEILITYKILNKNGLTLNGIHLEASSFNITECLGGLDNIISDIEHDAYTTFCDPRLNKLQTMELCDIVGRFISKGDGLYDDSNI